MKVLAHALWPRKEPNMTTLQIMENAKAATQSLMLCDETKKNEILESMAQSLLDHEKRYFKCEQNRFRKSNGK